LKFADFDILQLAVFLCVCVHQMHAYINALLPLLAILFIALFFIALQLLKKRCCPKNEV